MDCHGSIQVQRIYYNASTNQISQRVNRLITSFLIKHLPVSIVQELYKSSSTKKIQCFLSSILGNSTHIGRFPSSVNRNVRACRAV